MTVEWRKTLLMLQILYVRESATALVIVRADGDVPYATVPA